MKKGNLSFLLESILPYKRYYLLMILAPVITSFYPLFYNYSIKLIIDIFVKNQNSSYGNLLVPIIIFFSTQFILDFSWRVAQFAQWRSEPYVRGSLFLKSFNKVQGYGYSFFQTGFIGSVSSKIRGIVDSYDKIWDSIYHKIIIKVLGITITIVSLAIADPMISVYMGIWAFLFFSIMYGMAKKLKVLAYNQMEAKHKVIGQMSDVILNFIPVASSVTAKTEGDRIQQSISNDLIPSQIKMYKYDLTMQIVGSIMYWVMIGLIFVIMIEYRKHGRVTIGDFAFVFGMMMRTTEHIWSALIQIQDLSQDLGMLDNSISILNEQNNQPNGTQMYPRVSASKVVFENVYFEYETDKPIFDKLNLTINPGEKICLMGKSGSGKTTFANLILRFFDPQSGNIFIDNLNTKSISIDELRRNIAYVPQSVSLFHRSIMENILYGNPRNEEEAISMARKIGIDDFISNLPEKYNTEVGSAGMRLSRGQRQKILIARALLRQTPIIIMDEPISALDEDGKDDIFKCLSEINSTLIIMSHNQIPINHRKIIIS